MLSLSFISKSYLNSELCKGLDGIKMILLEKMTNVFIDMYSKSEHELEIKRVITLTAM